MRRSRPPYWLLIPLIFVVGYLLDKFVGGEGIGFLLLRIGIGIAVMLGAAMLIAAIWRTPEPQSGADQGSATTPER